MREVPVSEALKKKYPEQVVMVNAYTPEGRANTMAVGWAMVASGSPPYYAVGIGKKRFTMECVDAHGAFVVSFPTTEQERAMMLCGTKSGRDLDKERESGFHFDPATKVDAPLIVGAVANLECKLVHKYDSGDHYILVGEIVAAHVGDGHRIYNFGGGRFAAAEVPSEDDGNAAE